MAECQITEPKNLEEQALSLGGRDVYEKLIKGYTEKQWGRDCKELPAFIIKRLPFRFTYDNNYFNDRYQGIPIGGYNGIIEKMLEVEEAEAGEIEQVQKEAIESSNSYKRQQLVSYALQFVGGPYRYGGSDPHTGTDCSGFTRYVYQHGLGISLSRSSGSQASQGTAISASQIQPGDLLFYGSGKSINHVAMYIGDGKIVHASTEATGIKVSNWNYKNPVKIVSVLG